MSGWLGASVYAKYCAPRFTRNHCVCVSQNKFMAALCVSTYLFAQRAKKIGTQGE